MTFSRHPQRYSALEVAYFEPSGVIAPAVLSLLREYGFRHVHHRSSRDSFVDDALSSLTDLMLIETDGADDWVLPLVRQVRRCETRCDPFVPVITIHSAVTPDLAAQHRNSGVDALLGKPHSVADLILHIDALMDKPRLFVAADAYVGPERRNAQRPSDLHKVFQVPNRMALHRDGKLVLAEVMAWRFLWKTLLGTPLEQRQGLLNAHGDLFADAILMRQEQPGAQ